MPVGALFLNRLEEGPGFFGDPLTSRLVRRTSRSCGMNGGGHQGHRLYLVHFEFSEFDGSRKPERAG